jgi:hypothetical protein
MSFGEIVGWSLLCGAFVTGFASLAVLTSGWWWNEFAFKDMTARGILICGAGLFVVCTLLPMFFPIQVNWVEKEGPATIADEIERRLKD